MGRRKTGDRVIGKADSGNELQEQSRFLDGDRLDGYPGQMCGGRASYALDRLVEMTEVVGRVLRGSEHEQRKGQGERQCFDVLYTRPFHC